MVNGGRWDVNRSGRGNHITEGDMNLTKIIDSRVKVITAGSCKRGDRMLRIIRALPIQHRRIPG